MPKASQSDEFYKEPLEQSRVKALIVSKYFYAWAKNMGKFAKRTDRIAYIDFCCGRGKYDNGEESTPLLVVRQTLKHPDFARWTQVIFNDDDQENIAMLKANVAAIEEIANLQYQPTYYSETLTDRFEDFFNDPIVPTFVFLDPWGYKALVSREFIASTIRHWGCDCLFFFNYRRINRDLSNKVFYKNLIPLFGKDRLDRLIVAVDGLRSDRRERLVVREFKEALREVGVEHPLMFKIRHRMVDQTSHYLVFLSTASLAHHLMKDILAGFSERSTDNVLRYEFSNRQLAPSQQPAPLQLGLGIEVPSDPVAFDPLDVEVEATAGSIQELKEDLLKVYAGQQLTVKDLYFKHQYGTPYYLPNYKQALCELESDGRIFIDPPAAHRPKRHGKVTLADEKVVTFPDRR